MTRRIRLIAAVALARVAHRLARSATPGTRAIALTGAGIEYVPGDCWIWTGAKTREGVDHGA